MKYIKKVLKLVLIALGGVLLFASGFFLRPWIAPSHHELSLYGCSVKGYTTYFCERQESTEFIQYRIIARKGDEVLIIQRKVRRFGSFYL